MQRMTISDLDRIVARIEQAAKYFLFFVAGLFGGLLWATLQG